MYDRYSARLLGHLRHDSYTPGNVDRLMQDLGVESGERGDFEAAVRGLVERGMLAMDERGLVRLPKVADVITGTFRKNPKGFGFVKPSVSVREGDVFIPAESVGDALSGDTVKVEVGRRRRGGEEELFGRILEVVQRKRKVFTGELTQRGGSNGRGGQWLVFPDGRELTEPVVIRDPQVKNARAGDKVVIEITAYPENNTLAEGVIVDVLGAAGLPSVETQATIAAYNLPGEFSERVVAQARRASEQFQAEVERFEHDPENARREREDLREEFIITIDPPDAKDYDDAIHIKRLPDGWELGIHIADVAHFIPIGSPLDEEARARGNSCYLPRHVIPMLPEVLSNGICSLQEDVPRFCKSATVRYDRQGGVLKYGVAQTLIHSKKRLTYLEAQALIDGNVEEAKKHAKTEPRYSEQLLATLREMDACARAIRGRRRSAGMIHLDLPEVELVFDDEGRVVDAEREDDAFTHTIIEMFMVEANEVLAKLFERLKVPLLRRIHPEPPPGDVDELKQVCKVAGFVIPKNPTRMELQKLLDSTKGTPAAPAIHFAVLRTLTKAEYSPALVGHYALASEAYAHFTSPIRRYPDLTVHRALAEFLRHTGNGSRLPKTDEEWNRLGRKLMDSPNCPDEHELATIGRHCTSTEENAAAAEENLRSFLVLQLLAEHVGEQFKGMVTNCSNAGVFVQLDKYLASGLIPREQLPTFPNRDGRHVGGGWRLDPRSGKMVHESGRSFGIGDQVNVSIAKVDLALRRLDLAIVDAGSREKSKVRPHELNQSKGGGIGGGLHIDWDQLKHGKSGSTARSQRSKQRGKGKNHRRDS
jgi:ribonuclease R